MAQNSSGSKSVSYFCDVLRECANRINEKLAFLNIVADSEASLQDIASDKGQKQCISISGK